jgi:D-amino-acid oxidase
MFDVVVVGAGIVGLTCAVRLLEAGARVVVLTADDLLRTVSSVAAAVWYPTHTEGGSRVLGWAQRTYEELAHQAARGVPGVTMRPTRMLLRAPSRRLPWWAAAVRDFRSARPVDAPAGIFDEWRFTVPAVEMGPYLHWLHRRLVDAGGVLQHRRLRRLSDATELAAVVVNATGLGARDLAGDAEVYPARGQLVLVENPGLFTSVRDEDHPAGVTYAHPRSRDVVLGGTFEPEASDLAPDDRTGLAILARCRELVPELAQARVITQLVGLRPARRGGARVAVERSRLPGGAMLIHNYGHGGAGVTLSWGCADEVAALVQPLSY